MLQFVPGGFQQLQLDIVGFLAILGESSVLANAQVSSLSIFFLLPRLLPAPQALIRIARPDRLDTIAATVVGVYSGSLRQHVHCVANLLHDGSSLPDYSVRYQRVTKAQPGAQPKSRWGKIFRKSSKSRVTARTFGPLTFLSVLGCSMSISLLVLSIIKEDGMALLATILLSTLSTIVGFGSRWSLELKQRTSERPVPQSDIVIKYPRGAFHIIKCEENIARELYWHPEECVYQVKTTTYRVLSLIATLLLMFGVIFLGNATLTLQTCYAAAYLILNAAYWTVAALPERWNWDLSCFQVETIPYANGESSENFTEALWKAIAITRSTEWVKIGQIAPITGAWSRWLEAAGREAQQGSPEEKGIVIPDWDFDGALTLFLNPPPEGAHV